MRLKSLLALPECSIYALTYHDRKRIHLFYSTNTAAHLFRNLENIKYRRIKDKHLLRYAENYDIEILEVFENPKTDIERLVQKSTIHDIEIRFHKMGYKVFKPNNIPKFKFSCKLRSDGRLCLSLVTKQGDNIVIGIFDDIDQCETYKESLGSPKYIICNNDLTKAYYTLLKDDK